MGKSRSEWPFAALATVAAVAPFNLTWMREPWTDVLLRPLLVFALAVGLILVIVGFIGPHRRRADWIDGAVFAWLAMLWLSALTSQSPTLGAAGAFRFSVAAVVVIATRSVVRKRSQAVTLLKVVGASALVGSVVGLVVLAAGEEVAGTENLAGAITALGPWDRLTRPWQHANVAAMFLGATGATLALYRRRWFALPALAVVVVALALTYSRGGVLAGLSAALVWVAVRRTRAEATAAAALAGVVVIAMIAAPGWAVRLDQPGDRAWFDAEITAEPVVVGAGGGAVDVTIANESKVTWPTSGDDTVKISARWIDRDEGRLWGEQIWELPHELEPGASVTATLMVEPLVPDGEYDLRWDLTIPRRAYFEQFIGDDPVLTSGSVVGSDVQADAVEASPVVTRAINLDRPEIWRFAWNVFLDHPLLGVGPLQLGTATDELTESERLPGGHAHNLVLEPLATWGLFATVPFLIVAGGALASAVRRAARDRDALATVLGASLVAVAVHGLVDWPMVFVSIGIPIGVLVGLGWSIGLDALEGPADGHR